MSDSKLERAINLFDPQTGKSRPATDHKTFKIKRVELEPCRIREINVKESRLIGVRACGDHAKSNVNFTHWA